MTLSIELADHGTNLGQYSKITVDELTRLLDVVVSVSDEFGCSPSEAIERIETALTADVIGELHDRRRVIAAFVGGLRRLRMRRKELIGADLFRDPAWDMLLELFAAHERGKNLSVSSLCLASGTPPTTALRHVQRLEKHGLVIRQADPHDERRDFVLPTKKAIEGVEATAELLIQQTRFVAP